VNPLKETVRSNTYEVDKFPREASILRSLRRPVYCGMCTLCVVGVDMCKNHFTKAFKPLLEELKVGREAWACTLEECTRCVEQLCAQLTWAISCRSGRSSRSFWLVLLRLLISGWRALPLQLSLRVRSTGQMRPFPLNQPPSSTLQLRLLWSVLVSVAVVDP
jgi:hypothetical protein